MGTDVKTWAPWTAEDDKRIADMAAAGKTNAEIAEAIGRSTVAVATRMTKIKREGLFAGRRNPQSWTTAQEEDLADYVRAGKTDAQIAAITGRTVQSVQKRRQRLCGIKLREPKQKRAYYTPEDDAMIIDGANAGRLWADIASDLGRPVGSVTARGAQLRKRGLIQMRPRGNRRRWASADEELAARMYAAGYPVELIAETVRRDVPAVKQRMYERAGALGVAAGSRCGAKRIYNTAADRPARVLAMSDADIAAEYLQAKDPRKQIHVLAELNAATVSEILSAIVRGVGVRAKK